MARIFSQLRMDRMRQLLHPLDEIVARLVVIVGLRRVIENFFVGNAILKLDGVAACLGAGIDQSKRFVRIAVVVGADFADDQTSRANGLVADLKTLPERHWEAPLSR